MTENTNNSKDRHLADNLAKLSSDDNVAMNVYLRNFYIKDFKYISPEVMESLRKSKIKAFSSGEKQLRVQDQSLFEKWLAELMKGLKQFFYEGSLHGVKYIFKPSFSICEKITWVIIMVISVAICAVNIIQLVSKWTSTPFVNVIDSVPTPIWAVPFPTVVLCPHLHVKLSHRNVSRLNDLEQFFASLICPNMANSKRMEQQLNSEQIILLQEFIIKASPTCKDLIKACNWPVMHGVQWETENCCDLFQPIFTNYGLCYAFNSLPLNGMTNATCRWQKSFNEHATPAGLQWGLDIGYPKTFPPDPTMTPLRVMSSGESSGLGLELYLNKSEHQFACDGNSLGFSILISSPTDHVYTSTVIRLPMDRMTTVEVYPLSYKTDSSLRSLTPAQRQCFFQNERYLEYFDFYTDSNCKYDLLVQEATQMCDCVLFNWPRKNEWDQVCSTNQEYLCINQVKAKVEEQLIYAYYAESDEQDIKEESQSCHPSCNDVIYSSQVFYSDLITDFKSTRRWGQPKLDEVTQINIHFYDDMFLGQHRHAQYDQYYFAGAIGGLLSLFLGFSIISVAEIAYFVILKPAYIVLKEFYCAYGH